MASTAPTTTAAAEPTEGVSSQRYSIIMGHPPHWHYNHQCINEFCWELLGLVLRHDHWIPAITALENTSDELH